MDNNTNNPDDIGIEYLDSFYNQCISHYFSDSEKQKRKKRLIHNILNSLMIFILLISLAILYFKVSTESFITVFVALPFVIGIIKKFRQKIHIQDAYDEIDFECLTKYREHINCEKIAPDRPCCLTQQGIYAPKKSHKKSIIFSILVLIIVMVMGLAIPFSKYGVPEHKLWAYIMVLFFAASGIAVIIVPNIIKLCVASIKYKETVYAVCVEISHQDYSTIERPIFYAKCKNGHKYLLFKNELSKNIVTNVGDVVKFKADSNNPFNYTKKSDLYENILGGVIYSAFSMGLYILFNIYKL